MAVTDSVARWQKGDIVLGQETTITGASNADHKIRDMGVGVWPTKSYSIEEWDLSADADPEAPETAHTYGRQEPNFSIDGPLTEDRFAYFMASLCQSVAFSTDHYVITKYTDPQVALFLSIQAGIASTAGSVYKCAGCVARSVTLTLPPTGPDLGKAMLRAEMIGASSTRQAAFGGTPASIAAVPQLSSDWGFKLDGVAQTFTSAEITITNNAERSPNIGSTPDMINLGKFQITGNVAFVVSGSTADAYDLVSDLYEAATPGAARLTFTNATSGSYVNFYAHFDTPSFSEQGNLVICQFGFRNVLGSGSDLFTIHAYRATAALLDAAWAIETP